MSGRYADGTIQQSQNHRNPGDYQQYNYPYLVVGVITKLYAADHYNNRSAVKSGNRNLPHGSQIECEVFVNYHVNDDPWIIPNAVLLPSGASGIDDYSEELPRPATQMIDGSKFDGSLGGIDISKLDGDWCVVGFIGGNRKQPVILNWWPHPGNKMDPATSNFAGKGLLKQSRRLFKRYRGTKLTITNTGSLFVDTNEANADTTGSDKGWKRALKEPGGDIQVDVKPARKVQFNFNPPVAVTDKEPSVPPPVNSDGYNDGNPAKPPNERETTATAATMTKKLIELIAGEVVRIITNDKNIEIFAKTKVTVKGGDGDNSVILGSDDPSECDHAVKGETFQQLMNDFIQWTQDHRHTTSVGPTGPGNSITPFTQMMTSTHLSQPVKVKK